MNRIIITIPRLQYQCDVSELTICNYCLHRRSTSNVVNLREVAFLRAKDLGESKFSRVDNLMFTSYEGNYSKMFKNLNVCFVEDSIINSGIVNTITEPD